MNSNVLLAAGAVSAALSVLAGTFASHALKDAISPEMLTIFDTASRYQMYHAFGLFVAAWVASRRPDNRQNGFLIAGLLFMVGTILFCGSLYILVLTDGSWVTTLTPPGGISFLAGWIGLAWSGWKQR